MWCNGNEEGNISNCTKKVDYLLDGGACRKMASHKEILKFRRTYKSN